MIHKVFVAACALLAAACAASRPPATSVAPQERDYSPKALFHDAHGDFLVEADRYEPEVRARLGWQPNGRLQSVPGDFDMTELAIDGRVPIEVDPDNALLVGGHLGTRRYQFDTVTGVQDESLSRMALDLGFLSFLQPDLMVEVVFSPGVYSDLDGGLHSQDWQFLGHGIATWKYRDDLYLKAGLEVSQVFDDVPVYPVAGLAWLVAPQWRVDVLLPRKAEISWSPHGQLVVHGGFELDGQEYRVRSDAATGKRRFDFDVQELRLVVGGLWRFTDHLSAFGKLGTTLAGDHNFRTPAGVLRDGTMEPTFTFTMGVGLDF